MPSDKFCFLATPIEPALRDPASIARQIGEVGANGIVLTGRPALFGDEDDATATGLAAIGRQDFVCLIDIDPARFPIDHPLVDAHPDLFSIRRDRDNDGPVDPRQPMPAAGQAIARLTAPGAADVLADPIAEQLAALIEAGMDGFRFVTDRMSAALFDRIAAKVPDTVRLLSGAPPTASAKSGRQTASVLSFVTWGAESGSILERLRGLRARAPVIADLDERMIAPRAALAFAPLVADGIIVPVAWCRDTAMREAVARSVEAFDILAEFGGEIRQLTPPGASLELLARADAPDFRQADRVVIAIFNHGAAAATLDLAALLQPVGNSFEGFERLSGGGNPVEPVAPGGTRLLRGFGGSPITMKSQVVGKASEACRWPRLVVEDVAPTVAGGDFAVKRIVGDLVAVEATIYTDGHEHLGAELRWRAADERAWQTVRMHPIDGDRRAASFRLDRLGAHEFLVEGWIDRFGGFRRDFAKKLAADVAQSVDYKEGVALVANAVKRVKGNAGKRLKRAHADLLAASPDKQRELLLSDDLGGLMDAADERPHSLASPVQRVDAERLAARFSNWYELFPRSITDDKARHGTFADVVERLPAIRDMGFDTLYFPPIHPIGETNRKGPNNTLTPEPHDVGSPYAIGSHEGGHDAIHPALGGFADFDRLVTAAREHGLEIALDFAIQCAPDHPWLKEHPGWFAWRPDGSMKYAENPPKKYQDIVNVDFYGPDAVPDLWIALRDVVLLWIEHGVKTFRVDNPHTKPLPFWEWMIGDVRARHPDAIFLAEAFTRPTMMYRLAKVGFSQSYTYFTWRDTKQELTDYITELTTTAPAEFYRPHFFVNTPDINPVFLQTSGRAGFRIRAVLAATLSGLFGVYSGFELCESAPLAPGKEEYLDSEKYEIRPRDYHAPGNIIADITLLNRLRRSYPALQTHLNTRFYVAHNDSILWYGKPAADGASIIMVMVNLDPHHPQECDFEVPLWEFGLSDDASIAVQDLAGGHRFEWHGKVQHIRITPDEPYRIWHLAPEGGA